MHYLLRVLTHRRLTVSTFGVFLGLFLVSVVLPQRTLMSAAEYEKFAEAWPGTVWLAKTTGLDDVYRSVVMMVVFAAFTLQILAYLTVRTRRVVREAIRPHPVDQESLPLQAEILGGATAVARLREILTERRFHPTLLPDGQLIAVKNRFAPLAGLAFHASFVVILGGAWILKIQEFRGTVRLVEGQPFSGRPSEYASYGPVGVAEEDMPRLSLRPTKILPVFSETGRPVDVECAVELGASAEPRSAEIGVNRPLTVAGVDVLLVNYGLAPAITMRDTRTGGQLDRVCSRLVVWSPNLPSDTMRIRQPPATIHVRFFPDYEPGPDGPRSRSMRFADPVLELRIVPDTKEIPEATKLVRPGEVVRFGPFELRLDELRKWGEFQVIRERGGTLVTGFLLLALGACLRLLFVRRWVYARPGEPGVDALLRIGARAEYFPVGFQDEWNALIDELGASTERKDARPRES